MKSGFGVRFNVVAWSLSQPKWVQTIVDRYIALHDAVDMLLHHRETIHEYDAMSYRFSCVLCEVTNGMSKTNYDLDSMRAEIEDRRQAENNIAIAEFIEELDLDRKLFSITDLCEAASADTDAVLAARAKYRGMTA